MTAFGPGEWTVPWIAVDHLSFDELMRRMRSQGMQPLIMTSEGIRVCWRRSRYRRFRDRLARWVSWAAAAKS